jgi:hypothetical protein
MGVGPGEKIFGPSCNGGSAKHFYTITILMCQKNKLALPGTKMKHDIGVENAYS